MYKDKEVLVTGGTGMIGIPLVELLINLGAKVRVASLDDPSRAHPAAKFYRVNLTEFNACMEICKGVDYVFHLAGIKGSPSMTMSKPASFFVPLLLMNTNMMEAARLAKVERYLYTSTIGVYSPAEIFLEDDVWKTFPSQNDRFAGWAKRMGELQAEAYRIEYGWDKIAIVRPANVYGPFDNFDPNNAMVIPALIKRALSGEDPLVVWGDGSQVRDFIYAEDVARGMLIALEKGLAQVINLGSGIGVRIKEIVEIIADNMEVKPKIIWDISKPSGDKLRLMNTKRAESLGIRPQIDIKQGIKRTMEWYRKNKGLVDKRYNVFTA